VPSARLREKLGICQWFHFEAYDDVERTIALCRDLGVRHLRTGISWADFHRPGGKRWYDWQMKALHGAGLEVLLSVWHTPPSLAEGGSCAGPPRNLKDYADFIDLVISDYGDLFGALELWNEPNNRLKWDFVNSDPGWKKFAAMIAMAAYWAKQCGKTTVLGGMIPVDPSWLALMKGYGALEHIDVVAIHAFPGMWWSGAPNWDWYSHWRGWEDKVRAIAEEAEGRPIWVTETGLATWDLAQKRPAKHNLQARLLSEAAAAPATRVYWYSLIDLDPKREAIEGFHVDENEYHLGLVTYEGKKKPAYHGMKRLLSGALSAANACRGRGRM
jgi:CDP-paratose 2-epimerase